MVSSGPGLRWCDYFIFWYTDELSSILKKLSLEKYQPIFEEQEVFFFFFLSFFPSFVSKTMFSGLKAFVSYWLPVQRTLFSQQYVTDPQGQAVHYDLTEQNGVLGKNWWQYSCTRFSSSLSRWIWKRFWLWQMETWRSWALKQMDRDNRFWLLYLSSTLGRYDIAVF